MPSKNLNLKLEKAVESVGDQATALAVQHAAFFFLQALAFSHELSIEYVELVSFYNISAPVNNFYQ